jgi:hypothetical protein
MHPLDKIKFKAFDGEVDIHGTNREVTFMSADGDEPSVLIIKGLKLEDAFHVLDHLRGGLLKDKDAEQPALVKSRVDNTDTVTEKPTTKPERDAKGPIDFAKKAKEVKEAKAREAAKAKEPEPEPEQLDLPIKDEDEDDLDGDDGGELDVAVMAKMEKLREVIEHMVAAGHDTADKIVEVSRRYKNDVPLLRLVEEKGGFDKRMERNALVVLAGRTSSN